MIFPIYIYGSPVLRKQAEKIDPGFEELGKLIDDMFETMYSSEGVGLAAPQIGKSASIFIVDAKPFSEDEPELENFKRVFINAEIYERFGEEEVFNEGCLSFPGIRGDVKRHNTIKIRYMDENLVEQDAEFGGMAARIIQHEYDHIEGRAFIDHLSPLRRSLLQTKLDSMAKGKFKADYKCKLG